MNPKRDLSHLPWMLYGGDYNPEQWPESVWAEDVKLMQDAGVNLVSLGIFSWAKIEPREGEFHFDWLDRIIDQLHAGGIRVDLATATAAPPPWMAKNYPDSLPMTREGHVLYPGSRQQYDPHSSAYFELSSRLVTKMAERYGKHPAVVMWHINNEYACHVAESFTPAGTAAFRAWLVERYGGLDGINHAWGTAFWSQRYSDVEEILPPRLTPDGAWANPTQQLDFRRFASDLLLSEFVAERDLLRQLSPGVPITTNFMVMTRFNQLDYWRWAEEVDVVSTDYYPDFADPTTHVEAALCADMTRGLAGGAPWLLMETSPSAVNWQPRNTAKGPGQLRRDALQQIARGADGFAVFQVRQSIAGAEKFHSGLIPHAGEDTRLWREVVELGSLLDRLGEVGGSVVRSDVAIVWGYDAWWGCELDSHPSADIRYPDRARAFHHALWDLGITADVVRPGAPLDGYKVVVVPTLYLADDAAAEAVRAFVEGGGHAVVTYFSGIVDENDHVRPGGYPGAFRDVLGIKVDEFSPLLEGQQVALDDGGRADVWTEDLRLAGAQAVASYVDGPLPGVPAITRHTFGAGTAWYVATRTDHATTSSLVGRVVAEAGVAATAAAVPGVEVVRRSGESGSWLFVLNHTASEATAAASGYDLVSQSEVAGSVILAPGGAAVVRESGAAG